MQPESLPIGGGRWRWEAEWYCCLWIIVIFTGAFIRLINHIEVLCSAVRFESADSFLLSVWLSLASQLRQINAEVEVQYTACVTPNMFLESCFLLLVSLAPSPVNLSHSVRCYNIWPSFWCVRGVCQRGRFNDFVLNPCECSANYSPTRKGHMNSVLLEKVQGFEKYHFP